MPLNPKVLFFLCKSEFYPFRTWFTCSMSFGKRTNCEVVYLL